MAYRGKLHPKWSLNHVAMGEEIMFKDKYLSIVSSLKEAVFFIILQIFFETRAVSDD